MINDTAKAKPIVIIKAFNDEGEAKYLRLSVDSLRRRLLNLRESDEGKISFKHKGFHRTLSIHEVEVVILNAYLTLLKKNVPIPKVLSQALTYQYDRRSLIYNEPIVGRDTEILKLRTFITSRNKCKCMLVGLDGVGRTTIVKDIARQIILGEWEGFFEGSAILKVNLSAIPRKGLKLQVFLRCLKQFVEDYRDKIILHFDYIEDLTNYPFIEDWFVEQLVYKNTRIIGEMTSNSVVGGFFSIDMFKFINFLPVNQPEVWEITPLISGKVKSIESESGVTIGEKMVRFAAMTGTFLANSSVANPQLTLEVLNFAARNALVDSKSAVTKSNILAFYNLDFKLISNTELTEKYVTAYHEIGHYVVALNVKNVKSSKNAFVSILPINSSLGITASYNELGKQLTLTREYYLDLIACEYGGRVGEYGYTGTYSTGASEDIEYASKIAEMLVLSGGLAENEDMSINSYMWDGTVKEYLLTDDEKKQLREEIKKIRAEGFRRAKQICEENADLIAFLAEALVKDGILLGSELDELVKIFYETKA